MMLGRLRALHRLPSPLTSSFALGTSVLAPTFGAAPNRPALAARSEARFSSSSAFPHDSCPIPPAHLFNPPPSPDPLVPSLSSEDFFRNVSLFASGSELSSSLYAEKSRVSFSPSSVFANCDLSLEHIDAWGWDYDFTLVNYTNELAAFVYHRVIAILAHEHKYPIQPLLSYEYDPTYAIKGIRFDKKTGLFFKLDQFSKLQKDCVYRGKQRLPVSEVIEVYSGTVVSQEVLDRSYTFADLFAPPEACVLADVTDCLRAAQVDFDPLFVQRDVREAVERLHKSREVRLLNTSLVVYITVSNFFVIDIQCAFF